jgi:hypothetical protein
MIDTAKSYKTAGAFRAALEARLLIRARETGTDLQRLRRQVAFDRFLARTFSKGPRATYPWVLKGGYAMGAADPLRAHDQGHAKCGDHFLQADFPVLISSMSGLAIYHSSRRS